MPGLFITFEGIDGSGKSLQVRMLEDSLTNEGISFIVCREPGSTDISEKIRHIILDRENAEMSPVTEAYLYAASRAQLVYERIKPALEGGITVICDRFLDSSIVYQGMARGLGEREISELNRYAVSGLAPDLTVFLDIDPTISLGRKKKDSAPDRLESEKTEFHKKVREGYKKLASERKDSSLFIDATLPPGVIHKQIMQRLMDPALKNKHVKFNDSANFERRQ